MTDPLVPCRLGTVPIAAHQVLLSLWMLSSFLLDSLAVGGQTLVAVELGSGDASSRASAREISDRLLEVSSFRVQWLYVCTST